MRQHDDISNEYKQVCPAETEQFAEEFSSRVTKIELIKLYAPKSP